MSGPGDPGWKWFPNEKSSWSLDVVTLLAVIGESSMAEHSQTITASLLCLLPRLIPAPQALLKPSRPVRMPETVAKMTGVYSGTTLDSVGFFATIITPFDSLPAFSFLVVEIEHSDLNQIGDIEVPASQDHSGRPSLVRRPISWFRSVVRPGSRDSSHGPVRKDGRLPRHPGADEETGFPLPNLAPSPDRSRAARTTTIRLPDRDNSSPAPKMLRRRATAKEKVQDMLSNPTLANRAAPPAVPAKLFSPIHILSVFSCLLSTALIVSAIIWRDGNAILAVSLISLASTVVGYASFWHPILRNRKHTNEVPKGDVMIRTREGAFVLIKCTEEVARELYSGTEECKYHVGGRTYRLLMALGTTLLMLSVVLLGNCTWNSQIFIGGSYIVLNGLYWGLGMLPRSYFWDLDRYRWRDVTPDDAKSAHEITNENDEREGHPSFTRTLWFAIRETKLTGWVGRSGAAPGTTQWNQWLSEAQKNAEENKRAWKAVARKDVIMKEMVRGGEPMDEAAQHAPATEVQASSNNPAWNKDASF
ncbi:hypothetical protein B0J13DRAFT_246341 [Dactylonectria estremocensis]|uniref:Uncharacterized protein n=1 Tax=Dactylonectria estremocensis TaxID=1079267 RepID=A0A9P9F2E5_9HYPO|nr:hypothetical protein B0J13DRAFT_246341 [Dactylonectria estremocensis]